MGTNLAIDSTLLENALQIGGMKAETETINLALEEFIKKRAGENVISLFNTVEYDENYNYKTLRGKITYTEWQRDLFNDMSVKELSNAAMKEYKNN